MQLEVKLEEFFRSLLQKRSDERLINALAIVARMKVELPEGNDAVPAAGRSNIGSEIKGLREEVSHQASFSEW